MIKFFTADDGKFIDPDTGEEISPEELKKETEEEDGE